MLCTERYPSLSHSATVLACISQLESVMIASLQSVLQWTATDALRQTLCHLGSTISANTPFQAFEDRLPVIPSHGELFDACKVHMCILVKAPCL